MHLQPVALCRGLRVSGFGLGPMPMCEDQVQARSLTNLTALQHVRMYMCMRACTLHHVCMYICLSVCLFQG